MSEKKSRPRQSVSKPAWPARSNVYPALPHRPVAQVVSDSLHQAFVSIPDEGGASASASALHSAYSTDSVLTGLQTPLSAMSSPSDHVPRSFYPSSDAPFPDYAGSFDPYPFQHMQGDSQYSISSPGSSFPPRFVDSSSVDIDGVTSHQSATGPWTHLAATEGTPSLLPGTLNSDEPGLPSRHLRTPIQDRAYSSASAQKSLGDSGYETRSRRSQHEVDSVTEELTEMDESTTPIPPIPFPLSQAFALANSSTIAPRTLDPAPPESGRSATHRSQLRSGELECSECGYAGKTRSDLKKHSARHKREHTCSFSDCPRNARGFATINDLDRHLKAVHNINKRKSRSYKCFADGCNKAGKEWPRLDNFKQHLKKMHGASMVEVLLRQSNEWYEQQPQQAQADETASLPASVRARSSHSLLSGQGQFPVSDNNYPDPSPLFNPMMPARSLSHSGQVVDQDLTRALGPAHTRSQQNQSRPMSVAAHARSLQQQRGLPNLDTSDLSSPTAYMQRAWSQAEYSRYQDLSQLPPNVTNQRVNYQFSTRPPRKSFDTATDTMRSNFAFGYGQLGRSKRPNTIAVPDLDPDRMADFISPQELPHAVPDLRGSQEEFLGFVGSITNPAATDNGPGPSPHQSYQVNIIQPENALKSKLPKAIEEEIRSFLDLHRSNGGNDEEFLNQFRVSLRGSDVMTSYTASSVGQVSRTTDAELPGSFRLPPTKPAQFPCQYGGCTKVMQRQSELNKHMKRHWKPYGCVADRCTKLFGSKDDWKRHEQNQHEQQECWHCERCLKVLYHDPSNYIKHMREAHSVSLPEDHAKQRRIARNHQGRFWCGFCKIIVVHTKTDVDAITFRFSHIADHFIKEQKSSKDWIELTGNGKTKGELSEERRLREGVAEEEDDVLDASQPPSEATQPSPDQQSGFSPVHQPFSTQPVRPSSTQQDSSSMGHMQGTKLLPQAPDMPTTTQNQGQGQNRNSSSHRRLHLRSATFIICCQCGGSNAYGLSDRCMDPECNQVFCVNCTLGARKDVS
ncbi:uncharacterized protein PV07_11469 [Cladophialophora immunda]|uniref:C2H2-type domain-containing protein n=1 Tax=Cladophialophora immunda TaxID=569365 RepID=A0A0D2AED9_9EURO|nr:uncharacterized protein PV07_11469 [Cladophialophora immunda]KIW23257.1 hypothetical protein PV07_11469 [Cladophialophora immunda]OQV09088.1 hypothetical protein CLAIMM_13262 isoform 2 [Cladophialophora immunda]